MSDYIKREDAIKEANTWSMFGDDNLESRLKRLPSDDVVKVVRLQGKMVRGAKGTGWYKSDDIFRAIEECAERKEQEAQEEREIINARRGEE